MMSVDEVERFLSPMRDVVDSLNTRRDAATLLLRETQRMLGELRAGLLVSTYGRGVILRYGNQLGDWRLSVINGGDYKSVLEADIDTRTIAAELIQPLLVELANELAKRTTTT